MDTTRISRKLIATSFRDLHRHTDQSNTQPIKQVESCGLMVATASHDPATTNLSFANAYTAPARRNATSTLNCWSCIPSEYGMVASASRMQLRISHRPDFRPKP